MNSADTHTENSADVHTDNVKLEGYYRWHSHIYDATRWSFLFGREKLLLSLPGLPPQPRILEIGCGTGRNIERLGQLYPEARITGVDLSGSMLDKAARKLDAGGLDTKNSNAGNRVQLINARYGSGRLASESFDLILLSYTLTMMGPDLKKILNNIFNNMSSNGYTAVVDFNRSPNSWFEKWMHANHVQMDGSLLPLLKQTFVPAQTAVHSAYLGLWSYFIFIGSGR